MKRGVSFLIICFLTIIGMAQTQQGVAYQYNGKNPRTPLGNVTISYDADKRTTISGENGTFALSFTGKKMGDRIGMVTVKKREMMVFNQQAVDEWSVRKEPLVLILCNADEFERQKENLINIGRREAKKKYDRQKADLEAKLKASQIKEAEYEAALDKAYEELEQLQNNIGSYADIFARIDESEIDTLALRAVDAFNQGDVEKAIQLFEQGNYIERLKKAKTLIGESKALKAQIEQAEAKAKEDSIAAISSIRAQAKAYKLNNDVEKVGPLLKVLADELNTYYDTYNYAMYCCERKKYDEAETYIKRAIDIIEVDPEAQSPEDMYMESELIVELAKIYIKQQHSDDAIPMYSRAFRIREWLAEYEQHQRYSIRSYMLFKQDRRSQDLYLPPQELYMIHALAQTGNELANIYYSANRYKDCESIYRRIVNGWAKQTRYFNNYGKTDAAKAIAKLADFYFNTKQFQESEKRYNKAIDIIKVDKERNKSSSKYLLANIQYNLGKTFNKEKKYEESVPVFEEAINNYRDHLKKSSRNTNILRKNFSGKLGGASFYAIFAKKFAKAEQFAIEGLQMDSTKHWISGNLAHAILFQGRYDEAEPIYRQYKDELIAPLLDDFRQFAEASAIPPEYEADVEKIKRMLEEE
ncbi:MAG: tetratricopeptide repeat protein [Prevotella sp.]|nr:tetratricopeptide repeat protein [Prevotella sp.]